MVKKINIENLATEAIKNIEDDRKETKNLLNDLCSYIAQGPDRHKDVGLTMAKYLEVLQRSNEQYVKLISIFKTRSDDSEGALTQEEKDSIFEDLNVVSKGKK